MSKLNQSLEFGGYPPISRKTLFNDLRFLKEEKGAPINKPSHTDPYYYYQTKFSIKNIELDEDEIYLLRQASEILKKASPFKISTDIDLIIEKLENKINTNSNSSVIEFENNSLALGNEWIKMIFDAITCKEALRISYQPFNKSIINDINYSPYSLKEYRNRWFVIGKNSKYKIVNILALDRIKKISLTNSKYDDSLNFDSDEYFSKVVGISIPPNAKATNIDIKVKSELVPYVITKPLHKNQEIIKKYVNGDFLIRINVIINYELKSLLLSHGSGVIVKSPISLKSELLVEINKLKKSYSV
jgi:predicted DNA-binding transcriptional regulator YafY